MRYGDIAIRRTVPDDGEALAELRVIMLVSIFGDRVEEEAEREMVHNLCVLEEWRGCGVAREPVRLILAECRARNAGRIALYASDMGRGIYGSFGFREEQPFCPEMRLYRDDLEKLDL